MPEDFCKEKQGILSIHKIFYLLFSYLMLIYGFKGLC